MRVVTLMSDDRLRGLGTDDGADVGEISLGGSLGLAVFVTFLGVVGALAHLATRRWLPAGAAARRAVTAAWFGLVGGAQVVRSDGVDFTVLGEPLVSAAMFVALLAGYGWLVTALADRWLAPTSAFATAPLRRLAPLAVVLLPGVLLLPATAGVAAVATSVRRSDRWRRVWEHRAVHVAGAVVLAGVALASASDLVGTLADLDRR